MHAHEEESVRACMHRGVRANALAASYLHHKASPLSCPTYPAPRRLITLGSVQITRHASTTFSSSSSFFFPLHFFSIFSPFFTDLENVAIHEPLSSRNELVVTRCLRYWLERRNLNFYDALQVEKNYRKKKRAKR